MKHQLIIILLILSTFSVVLAQEDEPTPFDEESKFYRSILLVIAALIILFFALKLSPEMQVKRADRKLLKRRYRTILIDSVRDGIFEIVGEYQYNDAWAFDLIGEGDHFKKQFINPETDMIPLSIKNAVSGRRAIFITTDTVVELAKRMGYNPEVILRNMLQTVIKEEKIGKDDAYKIWKVLEEYEHTIPSDIGTVALTHIEERRKAEAKADKAATRVKELEEDTEGKVSSMVEKVKDIVSAAKPRPKDRGKNT